MCLRKIGQGEFWWSPNMTKLLKEKYFFSNFLSYYRYRPYDTPPWRMCAVGNYSSLTVTTNETPGFRAGYVVVEKSKYATFSEDDEYYFQGIVQVCIDHIMATENVTWQVQGK